VPVKSTMEYYTLGVANRNSGVTSPYAYRKEGFSFKATNSARVLLSVSSAVYSISLNGKREFILHYIL
jgi:hypothetical protein